MTLDEAKNVLRIDGNDNDTLINSLLAALPGYIELTTGMTPEAQANEPLVKTVSGFLITLWYFADHADDIKLNRTIDSLLKCITLKARASNITEVKQ